MKRILRTEVSWRFDPVDFFEAPVSFDIPLGTLEITRGTAKLTAPNPAGPDARMFLKTAAIAITGVFDARAIRTSRTYNLNHSGFVEIDEEGGPHYTVFPDSARIVMRSGSPDLIVTDPAGNIRVDTRATRVAADTAYVTALAAKLAQSEQLRRMSESFMRSLTDPDNALVHLYEIRDAAAQYFGSALDARRRLGISEVDWSTLGRLANEAPVREGRHRGRISQPLRNATEAELSQCREIARTIIEAAARSIP